MEINGFPGTMKSFRAMTLPMRGRRGISKTGKELEQARQRYGMPKILVENRIGKWIQ